MPTKHALNVSLTEPLRDFVDRQVQSGRFQTASEVVRAALRMLQDYLQDSAGEQGEGAADGIGLAKEKPERSLADAQP
jgi:antitoxin ParD1/3/4